MNYIGVTIGPIFKTLGLAKRTREIWKASYLFSYLMKSIIRQLINNGLPKEDILLPNVDFINDPKYIQGAGIYPDRLIFEANKLKLELLKNTIESVIKDLSEKINQKLQTRTSKEIQQYLDNFIQVYALEQVGDENKPPLADISSTLELLDLQAKFLNKNSRPILENYLQIKTGQKEDFLFKDAFEPENQGPWHKERFESLLEISTRELNAINPQEYSKIINKYIYSDQTDEDENTAIKELKKEDTFKDYFKTYHKYIAIVRADGDGVGSYMGSLNKSELKEFSEKLMAFSRAAPEIIENYGGTPIYAGGDDLLFFAPVVNRHGKPNETDCRTIFDLIEKLDDELKKHVPDITLSYGISISYYKFPMAEALQDSWTLLNDKAKKYRDKQSNLTKNAISFRILKHSGKAFGATFHKLSSPYTSFKNLLKKFEANEKHLNSIVYSFNKHREIFKQIMTHYPQDAEQRITNFFENSFNEPIHDDYEDYIKTTAVLVHNIYTQYPAKDEEQTFNTLYATLRTLQFLNRKDND